MSNPPPEETPPEEKPPVTAPAASAVQAVTAADLVASDTDTFPGQQPAQPPPGENGEQLPPVEPEEREETNPDKPRLGRPPKSGAYRGEKIKDPVTGQWRRPRKNEKPPPNMGDLPPSSGAAAPEGGNGEQPRPAAESPKVMVDYLKMAEMLFDMSTGIMVKLVGPEWQPGTPYWTPSMSAEQQKEMAQGERNSIVLPLSAYLTQKQMPDIPPGLLLLLSVGIYSSARMQQPNTKQKVMGLIGWMKMKFGRKKKPVGSVPNDGARAAEAGSTKKF